MAKIIKTITNTIKYWWIPGLIGLVLIVVGVWCFAEPTGTYSAITDVFSLALLLIGLGEIYFAISNRETLTGWGWYLTGGILSLIFGIVLLVNEELPEKIIPYFFTFFLLYRSIQGLGISFDLKERGILQWGNLAIISILGILFSFLLMIYPLLMEALLVSIVGLAFMFIGVIGVVISFTLNRIKTAPKRLGRKLRHKIQDFEKNIKKDVEDFREDVNDTVDNIKDRLND